MPLQQFFERDGAFGAAANPFEGRLGEIDILNVVEVIEMAWRT